MLFCPISPLDTGSQQPKNVHLSSSETTIFAVECVRSCRDMDTRWVPSRDHYDTTQNSFTGWISNPFTGSLSHFGKMYSPFPSPFFLSLKKPPSFFRRRLRWCRYSCPLLELVASRVQQRLSSGQIVPSSSMRPKQ